MGFSDHSYSIFRRQFGYADSRRNKPLFQQNSTSNRYNKNSDDEPNDDIDEFDKSEENDEEL